MLARLKKRVQEGGGCTVPPTMEVTQSSASLEDPRQSPLEVPDQSIHGEQPLGNPRTDIIAKILLSLQAGQESLLSEVAELRTSVNQTNERLKKAESRFSSLEDRICGSQQTNSIVLASPSDPGAVPASSSSSFSSQQMILDAAQTAPSPTSPSVYQGDTSSEPPPSSSEQFRNTSGTLRYSEITEKAHQMRADTWSREMNFSRETAHLEAEESDSQKGPSSITLPLITPECETEPQTLTSTEETALPAITAVRSLERNSESETALARAEESDQQEDTSFRALTSIAPEYEANPQPLTSTEEAALLVIAAVGSQETIAESKTAPTEPEESDQQANNFSGGSAQANTPELRPLTSSLPETPQAPALAAMQNKAQGRGALLFRRCSTNKRSSSITLTSTTTSAGTLSCLPSSSPTEVRPPTKRCRQTSIAWIYFTKQPKNIATCRVCEEDVQAGKIRACGNVGTAALLRHLERKHEIPSIAWQHFKMWSKSSAICKFCNEIMNIGKIGCGNVGTAALLSHLKHKHKTPQEKVAPSVVPGARSKTQNVERPTTTESPSRTTSAASASTTNSPVTLSCLSSSFHTEVTPSTKGRQTSIVWKYFTKQAKLKATCTVCQENVKIGKIGGCGNVGTAALLSHLERKHGITREKVPPSVVRGAGSKMQDGERISTIESPSSTT